MHIRRLLNASVLAFVCFCYSGGCNGEVNEQPEHFMIRNSWRCVVLRLSSFKANKLQARFRG